MATDPTTLTDLELAARFLYLQRLAFGGKVDGRSFGVDATSGARFNITKLVPMLEDVHDRLSGVTIERLPYQRFIERYDSPETLAYIDPPYWGTEDYYGPGLFSEADYEVLRGLLEGLEGSFIMTLNDCPQAREMFGQFVIQPVELHYTLSSGARAVKELVISSLKCHT
jgi:DNA adenine methylase